MCVEFLHVHIIPCLNVQAAFKRMDEAKDGLISKNEFRHVLETKLKIPLQRQYLDEIFKRADSRGDGYLDYEEFLDYFRLVPGTAGENNIEALDSLALCKLILQAFGGLIDVFQDMDVDGDGTLSREEFSSGLQKVGIKLSQQKLTDFIRDVDGTSNLKAGE